jgi:hypothetical protein
MFRPQIVSDVSDYEDDEGDDVFEEKEAKEDDGDCSETKDGSFNCSASTSIESVSDHFEQLFGQLETFTKTANEMDCIFVRRRMDKMKDGMRIISAMFEELLDTGNRLEKFLVDRQNNNNECSQYSKK